MISNISGSWHFAGFLSLFSLCIRYTISICINIQVWYAISICINVDVRISVSVCINIYVWISISVCIKVGIRRTIIILINISRRFSRFCKYYYNFRILCNVIKSIAVTCETTDILCYTVYINIRYLYIWIFCCPCDRSAVAVIYSTAFLTSPNLPLAS